MAVTTKAPKLPPPDVAWIDTATGRLTKPAYDYLVALVAYLETLRAGIP